VPDVELVDVTKRYGRIVANDHVNLMIKDREYLSIIGPSGCGKTTLIQCITGIIQPDEGDVFIDGEQVTQRPMEDRGIGYVFQNIALFPHMNVWENVTYASFIRGWPMHETRPLALEMLDMVRLGADTEDFPAELSRGSQQKTAIARSLVSRAKLLILDEPLGSLDARIRSELRYELRRLVKDLGLTALHVTHDQEEAMSISDRVIVMKAGRIMEVNDPIQLWRRPKNLFTVNFVGEANFMEGCVAGVKDSNRTVVQLAADLPLIVSEDRYDVGEQVVVAVRPQFIALDDTGRENQLAGRIIDVIYTGNLWYLTVELENGVPITVKTPVETHRAYTVDDKVTLSIAPDDLLLYRYPDGGLEAEIALE
jgi:ABC-type Fe3+/spermidine/putrescine transport system ATPase subunit